MKSEVHWLGDLSFSAKGSSSHYDIPIDGPTEIGGKNSGARPMELLLHGIAGCSGIDIVMILGKMRFTPLTFRIEIEGERADEEPKKFTHLKVLYLIEGEIPQDKVVRAIELSVDKYCSAIHSLGVSYSFAYRLNGELFNLR